MRRASPLRRSVLTFLHSVLGALATDPTAAPSIRRQAVIAALEASHPPREVRRILSRLKYDEQVAISSDQVELTPRGRARAQAYQLETLRLKKPLEWDGRWRIVIWDIPEARRSTRDQVRRWLRQLEFVRIQRSVWVTPYPCKDEITYLRTRLGINRGLIYLEAGYVEDQSKLIRHFHLTLAPDQEFQ